MRILQLISSGGLLGAERVVIELSKGLKQLNDCEPIVGVIKNSHNPHVEMINEAELNHIHSVIFECNSQLDPRLIFSIGKFIRQSKIDLVHCHGYKSNFYGLLASKGEIPTVATNHNWLRSCWKLKVYCFLDGLWIRFFDQIVAVSNEIKEDMLKYKIPEKKIRVIDNGIDIKRFDPEKVGKSIKKDLGIDENVKVIGTIGSLQIEKGHIYLLKAAKQVLDVMKDIKFIIVGDGSLRKQLEAYSRELGIEKHVIFMGSRKEIPELLTIMDVFVLPSIKEGLPIALLEAMAAKKPVIASRVGAIPKVIKNNENGILVEPTDIGGLSKSMIHLISNIQKARELALQGCTKIKKDFSSKRMCEKYMNLYKELLQK